MWFGMMWWWVIPLMFFLVMRANHRRWYQRTGWDGERQYVAELRRGTFVVDSRKDDCPQRCEYGAVCRVRQVRSAGKVRDDVPGAFEPASDARGGRVEHRPPAAQEAKVRGDELPVLPLDDD